MPLAISRSNLSRSSPTSLPYLRRSRSPSLSGRRKEKAVHLPELALSGGGLRGFGCTQRTRMVFDEWEMSMNQTHPVQQFTRQLLGRPMCSLTTRTLVVAIIDHCDRRARRTHHVVEFIHLHGQHNSRCFNHV